MKAAINEFGNCPLCGKNNHCDHSNDQSLGGCWCNEEVFPKEIFDLVPPHSLRKTCLCKNCLEQFKKENRATRF